MSLLPEAEDLMSRYFGHALGLADTVNATLAWRLARPAILSFDQHYTNVIVPRTQAETRLEVIPGPSRRAPLPAAGEMARIAADRHGRRAAGGQVGLTATPAAGSVLLPVAVAA
ncbi:hypothetical protein ABCR94_10965 [Streptomyces sp. 21So2-11]|uniref:hypothetical protein n=1 Tax=Streptomyces sp. 21So2-11 TaxID=3144408 RepID=UPI00321A39D6